MENNNCINSMQRKMSTISILSYFLFFRTSFDRDRISSVTFYKVHPNYVAKNSAQTGMRSRLDTMCWKLFCSVSKALLWLWVKRFYFTLCVVFCCACTDFVSWMDTHILCFPFTKCLAKLIFSYLFSTYTYTEMWLSFFFLFVAGNWSSNFIHFFTHIFLCYWEALLSYESK